MFVVLQARTPCIPCGYRLKHIWTGDMRVNKRSQRFRGGIGAMDRNCPECGAPNPAEGLTSVPLAAYRLEPEFAAKVAAYRLRRWPELTQEAS